MKKNAVKTMIRRCLGSMVAIVAILGFCIPGIRVDASTSEWAQINAAVESMSPSVTVRSSEAWRWSDMLSLEFGGANIETYTCTNNRNGTFTYRFTYNVRSLSEYNAMKNEINGIVSEIISSIPSCTTDIEKARMIHDWLVTHTTYDYTFTDPNSHNIYGVFHDHLATCSGFAAAYKFIMNRIGLDCSIVESPTHAWNQISTNPNIYVDCCWDNYDYVSDNGQEYIPYDFFAVEESEILTVEHHTSIENRSQEILASHPEYLAGDSIATVSFDSYNTESITYYCNQMRELGYVCFTLDFDNAEAYQTAVNELPRYMNDISMMLNIPESMCFTTNDHLQVFTIFVGEWHDTVANRG